jgi:hypothetical protein
MGNRHDSAKPFPALNLPHPSAAAANIVVAIAYGALAEDDAPYVCGLGRIIFH